MNVGSLQDFIELPTRQPICNNYHDYNSQKYCKLGGDNQTMIDKVQGSNDLFESNRSIKFGGTISVREGIIKSTQRTTFREQDGKQRIQYKNIKLGRYYQKQKFKIMQQQSKRSRFKTLPSQNINMKSGPAQEQATNMGSYFFKSIQEAQVSSPIDTKQNNSFAYHVESPSKVGKRFPNRKGLPVSFSQSDKLKRMKHPLITSLINVYDQQLKKLNVKKSDAERSFESLENLDKIEQRIRFQKNKIKKVCPELKKINKTKKEEMRGQLMESQNKNSRREDTKMSAHVRINLQTALEWSRRHQKPESYYLKALNKNKTIQEKEDLYKNRRRIIVFLENRNKQAQSQGRSISYGGETVSKKLVGSRKLSSILNLFE